MAEALASFLADQLAPAFISKMEEHVMLAVDAKREVRKLEETFRTIQVVLNDAEKRQFHDESVKHWLDKFKEVAYDMDDVLDEWQTVTLMRSQAKENEVHSCVCLPLSCVHKVTSRCNIGSRIKVIKERLDWICAEQNKFGFTKSSRTIVSEVNDVADQRVTSRNIVVDASKIISRDSEKEFILKKLTGESTGSSSSSSSKQPEKEAYDPRIISIIGMGGLGKTTLAQLIVNDDKVKTHFQKTIWICVSEPFDRKRIAKAIIDGVGGTHPTSSEWDALHDKLCDSVKGKQFLLVLDDVWTDDEDDLNPLTNLLCHGSHGSRIMVTTRNKSVAETLYSYQYPLQLLSSDDCWTLLSRKAFEGMNVEENETLKDIAMEIAKKCHGLPLAASILGGLMKKKQNERQWNLILKNDIWKLEGDRKFVKDKLFKPLLLSYDYLSSPLKRCFAYCAIFPKDHSIRKNGLIRMWMAQGFLNSTSKEILDAEIIGDNYFNDLAERSFFQDFYQGKDGSTICCKMHDIVHDFAQFLTENEFYVKQISDKPLVNDSSKARHLTITFQEHDEVHLSPFYASILEAKHLRSLRMSCSKQPWRGESLSKSLCYHLRCLRVLKLKNLGIKHLPSQIKQLIHLRYLDLSGNRYLILPDSICSLYNLETLRLKDCDDLWRMPRGMSRMINLKHLDIRNTRVQLFLQEGTGYISSFRLCVFGCEEFNVKELEDLNLKQQCIDIRGLGRLRTAKEASQSTRVEEKSDALVVEIRGTGLLGVLHPNFKELDISYYLGMKLVSWLASLTCLRRLELSNIDNCTELPACIALLPSLEKLTLRRLDNLKRIGVEVYGNVGGGTCFRDHVVFPKLEELYIWLENLEEWDIGDEEVAREIMPNLKSLTIGSEKLKALPSVWKLSSLESLEISSKSTEITHIGPEFYGICDGTALGGGGGGGGSVTYLIAFPRLKRLTIKYMDELEELDLFNLEEIRGGNEGGAHQIAIMPRLEWIVIMDCRKLKTVRAMSKLRSVTHLRFENVYELEELISTPVGVLSEGGEEEEEEDSTTNIIMPSLRSLEFKSCSKLKSLQQLLHLPKLNKLEIYSCKSLVQLPTAPNLTSLQMKYSAEDSSPPRLAGFPKLKYLYFYECYFVKSILEVDIRHLTELQTLEIVHCDWPPKSIDPDCLINQNEEEEAWRIMSHIPKITIHWSKYTLVSELEPTGTRQHSYSPRN